MLLTLAGCWFISDDELAQAIAERTASQAPPRLVSLEPTWGLTSGGEEIVLTGKNLGEDVEVWFGDEPAEITAADGDRLHLLAPVTDTEGAVEVSVRRGDKVDRLDDAYTYWFDGTDQVGLVGSLWYFQRRGDYWASSEQDAASLWFKIVQPAPEYTYWKYWSEELDTCSANPPSPYAFTPYLLGADDPTLTVDLTSSTSETIATWDATYGGFVNEDFPVRALLTTQSWRLQDVEVPGFPVFGTSELMITPSSWEVATPRIDAATLAPTDVSPLRVTWSGSGAVATVIQVGLLGPDGDFEAEVFCAATDDGEFEVPASFTSAWPSGREVHLLVGRYVAPTGTIPSTHARSAVYVMDWRYGAVRTE